MGFRWRRRNEGFEWRTYVRTTILLKRERRRKKADDIKAAAVFGIKQAGQKSADVAQDGLKSLERRGKHVVQRAGRRVRRGLSAAKVSVAAAGQAAIHKGSAAAAVGGNIVADKVKHAQGSVADKLKLAQGAAAIKLASASVSAKQSAKNNVTWLGRNSGRNRRSTAAGTLAISAAGVAAYRAADIGVGPQLWNDTAAAALIAIAAGCAAYLLIARWFERNNTGPAVIARNAAARAGKAAANVASRRIEVPLPALGAGLVALAAMAFWRPPAEWPSVSLSSLTQVAHVVTAQPVATTGVATVVTGDQLRIGSVAFLIEGIEAPGNNQSCRKPDQKTWNCADDAKAALANAIRKKQTTCTVTRHTGEDLPIAKCAADGVDIGADLVRSGHVFATGSRMADYSAEEGQAKTLRAGIWSGEVLRPGEWREARWQEAKRKAPAGCPIKGKVLARSAKVYMLPWASRYEKVRVNERRGERWFCSETEAQAAGWKPSGGKS